MFLSEQPQVGEGLDMDDETLIMQLIRFKASQQRFKADPTARNLLRKWERDFREAARADNCAILRNHLRLFGLRNDPQLILEGTLAFVGMVSAYVFSDLGEKPMSRFLSMQTYDPSASAVKYAFTFDLFGKAFGRILSGAQKPFVDLADLYGSPWHRYRAVGYWCLWISRTDRRSLTSREISQLKRCVREDLRYDYSEDQLDLWFDDCSKDGALRVGVHDHEELEEEDD